MAIKLLNVMKCFDSIFMLSMLLVIVNYNCHFFLFQCLKLAFNSLSIFVLYVMQFFNLRMTMLQPFTFYQHVTLQVLSFQWNIWYLGSIHCFQAYFCLRNKTSVPMFYRGNKIWVRVWVRMIYDLITCTRTSTHNLFPR